MKYKIFDNLLPDEQFVEIKNNMLGPWIPWAFNSAIVKPDHPQTNSIDDFQFTHTFYRDFRPTSDWISLLDPILNFLKPSAIVRIKANLLTRTETQVINQYHLDHEHFDGKIAIFYINSNNGYTLFDDGTKIESVENRLVIFDPSILHTGTTCTDQKVRCLINFMFYSWTDNTL